MYILLFAGNRAQDGIEGLCLLIASAGPFAIDSGSTSSCSCGLFISNRRRNCRRDGPTGRSNLRKCQPFGLLTINTPSVTCYLSSPEPSRLINETSHNLLSDSGALAMRGVRHL